MNNNEQSSDQEFEEEISYENEDISVSNQQQNIDEQEEVQDNDAIQNEQSDQEQLEQQDEDNNNLVSEQNYFDFLINKEIQSGVDKLIKEDVNIFIQQKEENQLQLNEQKKDIIIKDQQELFNILQQISKSIVEIQKNMVGLKKLSQNEQMQTNEGISILNAKFLVFLDYLINLHFYILQKIQGQSIQNSDLIKKLIYQKTLLSKLKPIEKKLEYQINKLLKMSITNDDMIKKEKNPNDLDNENSNDQEADEMDDGQQNQQKKVNKYDKLAFKPRPEMLDLEEDDQQDENNVSQKIKAYVPPKLTAVLSKEDKLKEKLKKQQERRAIYLQRKLRENLLNEFTDEKPQEIKENLYSVDNRIEREEKQRTLYEEQNFTRLPVTKKDKKRRRILERQQGQEKLDDFQEMREIRELLQSQNIIEKNDKEQDLKRKLNKDFNKKQNQKFKKTNIKSKKISKKYKKFRK